MKKYFLLSLIVSILLVSIFFLSTYLTALIPRKAICKNALTSAQIIDNEGLKHRIAGISIFRLDNFTDALMINIAMGIDENDAARSISECKYTFRDDRMSVTQGIRDIANNDFTHNSQVYSRYWHGYLLFLRPALAFTDYNGIRTINYILFTAMIAAIIWLAIKRKMVYTLMSYIISILAVNFFMVPLSMQFSNTFYISFIAILVILAKKTDINRNLNIFTLFFITGGLTSFIDLLTTPLITLCLPLLFLLGKEKEYKAHTAWKAIGLCTAAWIAGYSIMWICKWIVATQISGYNISEAIEQVTLRMSTSHDSVDMSLRAIANFIASRNILLVSVSSALLLFVAFNTYIFIRYKQKFIANSCFLLIAFMPLLWVLAVRNHSVIHYWFVWRLAVISVFAYSLFLFRTVRSS